MWWTRLRKALFAVDETRVARYRRSALRAARMLFLALREFRADFCFERAGSLTFASIISFIPLAVLFFSFAGLLGGGEQIISTVEEKVFPYLAPEFQEQLSEWLKAYISTDAFRAGPTGIINLGALLGLILSALGVLITAERVLNRIWKVRSSRTYLQRFAAFWVILTTSPFMIIASIWLGDFLVPEGGIIKKLTQDYWVVNLLYDLLVPTCVGFIAFSLVYLLLPATRVRVASAAAGGIVAALLWELSKRGFYFYVRTGTVTNFYKQLATVPLFLIWLYVTWGILLLGSEIAYAHQNLEVLSRLAREDLKRLRLPRVLMGLYLLLRFFQGFCGRGKQVTAASAAAELEEPLAAVEAMAQELVERGVLVEDGRSAGVFVFARHPSTILLRDVVRDLLPGRAGPELLPPPAWSEHAAGDAARRLDGIYRGAHAAFLEELGDKTLEDLGAP